MWDPHLGRKFFESFRPMAFPSRIYLHQACRNGLLIVSRINTLAVQKYGSLVQRNPGSYNYLAIIIWSREELGIVDRFLGAPMVKNTQRQSDSYNLPLGVPSAFRHKRGISYPLIWSIAESKKIGKW